MKSGKEIINALPLWPNGAPACNLNDDCHPALDVYLAETSQPAGAILICPGGGYAFRAPHEGRDIAMCFNEVGLHAFVVQYRVKPHVYPASLLDASKALKIIRDNASCWKIKSGCIAVCGFSAGGHLAASLGVFWNNTDLGMDSPAKYLEAGPDAMILCYPVISSGQFAHKDSFKNLLGENASEKMWRQMSLELHVNRDTPPAFLWHTFDDAAVPVENTLLFAKALREHNVPFELHIYAEGVHGLGLAPDNPYVATWMPMCCQWLKNMGWQLFTA